MTDIKIIHKSKSFLNVPNYVYKDSRRFDFYQRERHDRDTKGKRLIKKKMRNYSNRIPKINISLEDNFSDSLAMFVYLDNKTIHEIKSWSIHGRGNYSPGDLCNTQISFDEARGKDTKILEAYNPEFFISKI